MENGRLLFLEKNKEREARLEAKWKVVSLDDHETKQTVKESV